MANNSVKRDQNRQKELAYIRKVKQTMQPKSTEERNREIAAEQAANPRTIGSRIADFFYLYKWRVVLIVLFSGIAIFLLVNYLTTRPVYDTRILAAYSLSSLNLDQYSEAMSKYGYDFDKNGVVEIDFMDVCLSEDQPGNVEIAERSSLAAYLQLKDVNLYLLDDSTYQELMGVSEEAFVNLSELYPDNPNVDGRRFLIEGSQLEDELGADKLPDQIALVIRTEEHAGNNQESYDISMKLLQNIIENKKTQTD